MRLNKSYGRCSGLICHIYNTPLGTTFWPAVIFVPSSDMHHIRLWLITTIIRPADWHPYSTNVKNLCARTMWSLWRQSLCDTRQQQNIIAIIYCDGGECSSFSITKAFYSTKLWTILGNDWASDHKLMNGDELTDRLHQRAQKHFRPIVVSGFVCIN